MTGNLLANLESYEALSAEHQTLIQDAAVAEMTARFATARAEDQHYVDLAVADGMEYFELTDEQLAPIVEKVRAEVWPQMEPDVGKEIMDLVRAQAK